MENVGGLNDHDVGVACLSLIHRRVLEGGAGHKMSHVTRWAVCQSRNSREWRQQMVCVQACVFRPAWWDTVSHNPKDHLVNHLNII